MEEEEGQPQSTLLVTGWKVERGRASGDNNYKGNDNDHGHDNKDKDEMFPRCQPSTYYIPVY